MKKTIVISGINIVDGGAKSVFDDLLNSIVTSGENKKYNIIILVSRKSLFKKYEGEFTIIEFPKSKKHWLNRIYYEYIYFKRLSKKLKPEVWLSMHDITPNVTAKRRYVYCHNPSPFYKMPLKDVKYGWKYYLFSKFYKYLYKINIKKNDAVIVQQQWLGSEFKKMYKIKNIIVAYPQTLKKEIIEDTSSKELYRFIYPSFPRIFKNFEVVCEAAKILNDSSSFNFEVLITLSGRENNYSRMLKKQYKELSFIKFIGLQSRENLFKLYGKSNCLIFMSKLETWGMPLSEFIQTNKPIITTNLPYAYETMENYRNVAFVDPNDSVELAKLMKRVILNKSLNNIRSKEKSSNFKYVDGWENLFNLITKDKANGTT